MKKWLLSFIALSLPSAFAYGQYAVPVQCPDSLKAPEPVPAESSYSFSVSQIIAPSVLAASALTIHYVSRDESSDVKPGSIDGSIRHFFYDELRQGGAKPELAFDNYLQYAPFVMDLGLGMVGVRARHSLLDRTLETAIGSAACAVLSWSSKVAFCTRRPNDHERWDSFPSGHTDTAFLGAELTRIEYGWGWGAGAYAMGVTVGTMRLYNNWHWFSDVLFGAAIGIISANVGAWLLEPVKDLFHIPTVSWDGLSTPKKSCGNAPDEVQLSFIPSVDPYSGACMASFALTF